MCKFKSYNINMIKNKINLMYNSIFKIEIKL